MNEQGVERRENELRKTRTRRRQRCSETKVEGGVNKNKCKNMCVDKEKGVTRLFLVNYNGFGCGSK